MSQNPTITIGVVLHGNEKYFSYFLKSILHQDYTDFELLLRDQSPDHQTSTYLEKHHQETLKDPRVRLVKGDNRMHSGGHNALINQMQGEAYICASYDMYYRSDFLTKVQEALTDPHNTQYGVLCPKIRRWDFARIEKEGLPASLSSTIDSCGIGILPSHYCFDIGQTQTDTGQYDEAKEVFGASGALAIFRKSALSSIAFETPEGNTEYFDELIHYKNDIDLAYRLQWAGERCRFLSEVIAYHDRQVSNQQGNMSVILRVLKNRKGKSRWVKENSFWGHLVMMRKNTKGSAFSIKTKIAITLYWLKILIFMTFLEPFLWKTYFKYRQTLPLIDAKKKALIKNIAPSILERWLSIDLHNPVMPRGHEASPLGIRKLSLVILDYRKGAKVVENIKHLWKQKTDFPLEIIVVDNSVDKNNADILETGINQLKNLSTKELKNGRTIKLIINEKNVGYTRGNNQGAIEATGDYIAIINPDIQCEDLRTLQSLVNYLEQNPDVGMVGPRQITPKGKTEMTVRAFPKLWIQIARRTFLRYLPLVSRAVAYDEMRHLDYDQTQSVHWLQSSFIVMRHDLWKAFGGFDEDYFIFMSDSEICWQCWKVGYKVIYLADAKVYPDGVRVSQGGLCDFFKNWVMRQHFRDACRFLAKHLFEKIPKVF